MINFIDSKESIPLSLITGFLCESNILERFTDVFNEISKVFKFLLFMPIQEFSNDKAISASFWEWTSTRDEIFKSLAAWYKSLAKILSTADNIIKMQSAPKLLANGTW